LKTQQTDRGRSLAGNSLPVARKWSLDGDGELNMTNASQAEFQAATPASAYRNTSAVSFSTMAVMAGLLVISLIILLVSVHPK